VRYLGESRHWIERLFWVFAFCLSVTGCYVMISETYEKWQLYPVIMTPVDEPMSVWNIPFPAITICPERKAIKTKFNYLTSRIWTKFEKFSDHELRIYEALQAFGRTVVEIVDLQPNEMYFLLKNITEPPVKYTIYGDRVCYPINLMTEEGLCSSINLINSSHLLQDKV
jgi:acid-sensing ion channel, other